MPANLHVEPLQGNLHISTGSGADGASPEGSVVDGASPMSLAAGADFADLVHNAMHCTSWPRTLRAPLTCFTCTSGICCWRPSSLEAPNVHPPMTQELEALKTSGGGDAESAAAAAKLAAAASPHRQTATEFSPQGRVVQLADLPASALPTTDAAPPVTAASASIKTVSESGRSAQVCSVLQVFWACLAICRHAQQLGPDTSWSLYVDVCRTCVAAGGGRRGARGEPVCRGVRHAVPLPGQPDAAPGRVAVGLHRQPGRR
jgi:hypothetical protein